jgi:hypothetical protein
MLRTDDVAVIEIESCDFIGTGSTLAQHVAERLLGPGLPTAVTVHLAGQIFREVKGKGVAVGGNTEIYARRKDARAEQFFDLTLKDYRFIWGLEDILLNGIRDALNAGQNKKLIDDRLRAIGKRIRGIRADA